ncbi:hypothetical protein EXIGLDRAFT_820363 [Exidia glandulosa HHB12029]|uniref:Uncharacterized protein n=1 Tax=Exidia glandulosa HHB12029 TaxID=1314781 RepID=A0A165AU00_EXIGL|nr:hypothetical protein EXIGLDRAFT_820363 [Exidia glandulosa HHB12029]
MSLPTVSVAPPPDVIDEIKAVLEESQKKIPRRLRSDKDVAERMRLLGSARQRHAIVLQEASDLHMFGSSLVDRMIRVTAAMEDTSDNDHFRNYLYEDLTLIREHVDKFTERSHNCYSHLELVVGQIKTDLNGIRELATKFEKRFKKAVYWLDPALSVFHILAEGCSIVAACPIPAVSPAMQGGRVLCNTVHDRLSREKSKFVKKQERIVQIHLALLSRLDRASAAMRLWAEVQKEIKDVWNMVDTKSESPRHAWVEIRQAWAQRKLRLEMLNDTTLLHGVYFSCRPTESRRG